MADCIISASHLLPFTMTTQSITAPAPIRVKVLTTIPLRFFEHQLPDGISWGRCQFSFDPEDRNYDWLVVYDDLPARDNEPRSQRLEHLACPRSHTILTTSEPSTIKHYGNRYTSQYGYVITSQPQWALPHPGRIYSQAGLVWFYGVDARPDFYGDIKTSAKPFEQIANNPPVNKTVDLSMVFTSKRQRHTQHHHRYNFMRYAMQHVPELTTFGYGIRPFEDKADALDAFRYHIAIENYNGIHHWTEKLADAFLGLTLPFYSGCTNAADYFPPESFIPIDITDLEGATKIIREAIANNEYEKRLPAIIEARRRVLYEHNFFALVAREIEKRHQRIVPGEDYGTVYSRHYLRSHSLINSLQGLYGKSRARIVHLLRHS